MKDKTKRASKKVVMLPQLNLRKIKASMPEKEWRELEERCITYRIDINLLVAALLRGYVHSPDGMHSYLM